MDKHDKDTDSLAIGIKRLLATNARSTSNECKILNHKLTRVKESLEEISDAIQALPDDFEDVALIQQYQEELTDDKLQLSKCQDGLSNIDVVEGDDLLMQYSRLKKIHFDCCHAVKKLLSNHGPTPHTDVPNVKGLKIPKLESPTFDGDILNWTQFWEQFAISIDEHTGLSDSAKFVYLQHALKGGSAKSVIEGLQGTGEHYSKAVECLKTRYDRPCLIHQSHVKLILETPSVKESNGKELRKFHDTLSQHLRALDACESEPLTYSGNSYQNAHLISVVSGRQLRRALNIISNVS